MTDRNLTKLATLHETLATCHPKLTRGQVWCHQCGATQRVDSAACLRSGWPRCCGQTMAIDSPAERRAPGKEDAHD